MTGKDMKFASLRSLNSVDIGWPYGRVIASLTVRYHPRHGKDAIFRVSQRSLDKRSAVRGRAKRCEASPISKSQCFTPGMRLC
jgi:hypothetical protein